MSQDQSPNFGNVRNDAEDFGTIPKDAEGFRTLRNSSERKESHTLTVRDAARMFEAAGVARTERSIINWCQPNRMGVARLDCDFDSNDRKYFITEHSVQLAIKEEQAKTRPPENATAESASIPKDAEREEIAQTRGDRAIHDEILDLKITNRAKDMFIKQLQDERASFDTERRGYVEQLMGFNRKVGELETRLLQLDSPSPEAPRQIPKPDSAEA